jgi:uncharacterized delta-60 repeat protein
MRTSLLVPVVPVVVGFLGCVGDDPTAAALAPTTDSPDGSVAPGPDSGANELTISVDQGTRTIRTGDTLDVIVNVTSPTQHPSLTVTFEGLPDGVTADPLTIDASQASGTAKLRAKDDAKQGVANATVLVGPQSGERQSVELQLDVMGAPGTLDTGFGSAGIARLTPGFSSKVTDLTILPDGKIVTLLGDYVGITSMVVLAQLSRDGSVDNTFGTMGTSSKQVGTDVARPGNLLRQPDGSFVTFGVGDIDGAAGADLVALHFASQGAFDGSFGIDGIARAGLGSGVPAAYAIGCRSTDGKLVVVGDRNNHDLVFARFDQAGALDSGPTYTTMGGSVEVYVWRACEVLQDNSVIVGGHYVNVSTAYERPRLVKLDPNGHADKNWVLGAGPHVDIDEEASFQAMARQADGKIIVVGHKRLTTQVALHRVNPIGQLDTTFGSSGHVYLDIGTNADDDAFSVAIDGQGRIVVTGWTTVGAKSNIFVLRLTPKGELDPTFANGGKFILPVVGDPGDRALTARIGPDGRIVVGGYARTGTSSSDALLVRFNP